MAIPVFFAAVRRGDLAEVQRFYELDPSLALVTDLERNTAIELAAKSNRVEVVRYMLDVGGRNPQAIARARNAMWLASAWGNASVVRLLLENGIDSKLVWTRAQLTALQVAADGGHVSVLEVLLTHSKADVDRINDSHRTAVLYSCYQGHVEAARALLEAGADPKIAGWDGKTPMIEAIDYKRRACVALLQVNQCSFGLCKTIC